MPSLNQTTLAAAVSNSSTVIQVASATNIVAPTNGFFQKIYVIDPGQTRGELMTVLAVSGAYVSVSRLDAFKAAHASGAIVLIASVDPTIPGFYEHDPDGAPSTTPYFTTPYVNVTNGYQWLQAANADIWVPGWNNPMPVSAPTAAVASAAGAILPSGRLFHVTGTAAVTGFTIPTGFAGGSFTIIPDGIFTWTTAGNIGLAGTAVVGKALIFQWDENAGKFYPSYIA